MLFDRFFAIFDFIKHLLHESVNSFFTSKNLYWFTIFVIITTNQLVPLTAIFVFLIFVIFLRTTLIFLCYSLKVSVNHEWYSLLFVKVFEFENIVFFGRHFDGLCSIQVYAIRFVISQNSFRAKTLETVHAKVLFVVVLCLIEHEFIEIFDENIMIV